MKTKTDLPIDKRAWHPSPLLGQLVLVTTLNADGTSNVAPKSWVSMMAFDPPIVALGCNVTHWTGRNALERHQFVINVPGDDLAATLWGSHDLPHPRPVEALGLTPVPARVVKPPRIDECRAHLECELQQHVSFGSEIVLFGRLVAVSIDQQALDAADPYAYLRLAAFLENRRYGVIEGARTV